MSESRTEQVAAQYRGVRVGASEVRRAAGRSVLSQRSVGAARPAAVSAPAVALGRALRWCVSTVVPLSKQSFNTKDKQPPQFCSLMPHSRFSLALRSTAAPGTAGSVGTGFARAAGARVLRHRNSSAAPVVSARMLRHQEEGVALVVLEGLFRPQPRPNPSFEGTCSGKLRLPTHAPQVKR